MMGLLKGFFSRQGDGSGVLLVSRVGSINKCKKWRISTNGSLFCR